MRILYYDCFAGISGDMNLGAMIDLGVKEEYLKEELAKLNLDGEFQLEVKRDSRKGISGTKVDVILLNQHEHRNLLDIEKIIDESTLSNKVKVLSKKMFLKVAEAEAKVHGKELYEVHFHEVGATDSIVDIIGASICLDYLKVDKVMASAVQVGGGFVKCEHGLMPVPAPATAEILKGIPITSGIVKYEATTPTGAAILATAVEEFTDFKDFVIEKTGYGVGTIDKEIPNVLRLFLAKKKTSLDINKINEEKDYLFMAECNIDDMNPELYGFISEKLFSNGALDVFKVPIIMKKGRAALVLSVLYNKEDEEIIEKIIFTETTTLGIRKQAIGRVKLCREMRKVATEYGEVNVKVAFYKGKEIKYKAEYEDCKKIALEKDIPINKVYKAVMKNVENNSL